MITELLRLKKLVYVNFLPHSNSAFIAMIHTGYPLSYSGRKVTLPSMNRPDPDLYLQKVLSGHQNLALLERIQKHAHGM